MVCGDTDHGFGANPCLRGKQLRNKSDENKNMVNPGL